MMQGLKTNLFIFFITAIQIYSSGQDSTRLFTYDAKLNISGRHISGTFNQFVIANGVDLRVKYQNWSIKNILSYRYNKTANHVIEDNWYELLTISYRTDKSLFFPTFFYHFDNSLMFQIVNRHLVGVGLSSTIDWKKQQTRIDVGIGHESTEYTNGRFENTHSMDPSRHRPILISRLFFKNGLFEDKIVLTNDLFYRHSMVEVSDYLFLLSSKISLQFLKNARFFTNYEYRFENVYLTDLSPSNSTLLFGLTFHTSN